MSSLAAVVHLARKLGSVIPHSVSRASLGSDEAARACRSALLDAMSGPCVRHLALASTIAALHVAEGGVGATYGMPPLLLRCLPVWGENADGHLVLDLRQEDGCTELAETVICVTHVLADTSTAGADSGSDAASCRRPSVRVALELLLRLGRLAVASARLAAAPSNGSSGARAAQAGGVAAGREHNATTATAEVGPWASAAAEPAGCVAGAGRAEVTCAPDRSGGEGGAGTGEDRDTLVAGADPDGARRGLEAVAAMKPDGAGPPSQVLPQPLAPVPAQLHRPLSKSNAGPVALAVLGAALKHLPAVAAGARRKAAAVELWRLAVDMLEHVSPLLEEHELKTLVRCVEIAARPPPPAQEGAPPGGVEAAPAPQPEISAAVAGGLLPWLERAIRRHCRGGHCTRTERLLSLLVDAGDLLSANLLVCGGDLQQAMSLRATVSKAVRARSRAGPVEAQGLLGALPDDELGTILSQMEIALMRAAPACLVAAARAAAAAAADREGGEEALLRRVAAVVSQGLHVWSATARGMLVHVSLKRTVGTGRIALPGTRVLLHDAVPWVQLLVLSVEAEQQQWQPQHAAAPAAGASSAAGAGSTAGAGAGADGAAPEAARRGGGGGARGWRVGALRSLSPLVALGRYLRYLGPPEWRHIACVPEGDDAWGTLDLAARRRLLADCLCRVARALLGDVRQATAEGAAAVVAAAAAQAPSGSAPTRGTRLRPHGGRGRRHAGSRHAAGSAGAGAAAAAPATAPAAAAASVPESYWPPELVRWLAGELRRSCGQPSAAEAVDALAVQLEVWAAWLPAGDADGPRSAEDVLAAAGPLWAVALPAAEPEVMAAARSLLSPAEVAALLRTCSNPRCVNLEGDSEAGLRLAACGRCGGEWYCCRDCQLAHWRAGHMRACAQTRQ